jgi:prepilin-type N-terminal cleavage/methylation domain-containing protein
MKHRAGFTLVEVMMSLAALAGLAVLVAQLAAWSLTERERTMSRSEASEIATNVLELAEATPWDELTPEWAAKRQLPESFHTRWPESTLIVKVESEPNRDRVKRVSIEVRLTSIAKKIDSPILLTGMFAARSKGAGK